MNLKISLFALFIFTHHIFPQSNQNQVLVNMAPNGDVEWRFSIEWNSNFQPSDGIEINLPETLMLIPVSIVVNNKELWLQNTDIIPEQDSVVSWQSAPGSIILLFKSGLVKNGDQLSFSSNGSFLQKNTADSTIHIKDIVWQSGTIQTSDIVQASGKLPVIPNKEEK